MNIHIYLKEKGDGAVQQKINKTIEHI
jgi:hypothetical protein